MQRIPILATGAVLASLVLCGGAVTVANALTSTPGSDVLGISGVSTSPTPTSSDPADEPPSPSATPSASETPAPGGVTVVSPSDPTKIDGKNCAHLGKHSGSSDPSTGDSSGTGGGSGSGTGWTHHRHGHGYSNGTPVPQDPDTPGSSPTPSSSATSGSDDGTGDGADPGDG